MVTIHTNDANLSLSDISGDGIKLVELNKFRHSSSIFGILLISSPFKKMSRSPSPELDMSTYVTENNIPAASTTSATAATSKDHIPLMTDSNMHLFDNEGNYVGEDGEPYESCSEEEFH